MDTEGPRKVHVAQDATTGEEISGTTIPPSTPDKEKRNACSFLFTLSTVKPKFLTMG